MSKRFNDPEFRDYDKRYHINHTRADKAWDITTGDTSVVIAIIDNAFDLKHKEIKSNLRKVAIQPDESGIYLQVEVMPLFMELMLPGSL